MPDKPKRARNKVFPATSKLLTHYYKLLPKPKSYERIADRLSRSPDSIFDYMNGYRQPPEEMHKLLHIPRYELNRAIAKDIGADDQVYVVYGSEELGKIASSYEDLLDKLITLDHLIVSNIPTDNEGTVKQWAPIFEINQEGWRVLWSAPDKRVVGYFHYHPLDGDTFEKAKYGSLLDSEIQCENVEFFVPASEFSVYIVMFGIEERYRKGGSFKLLMSAFLCSVLELAREEIFIKEWCAMAGKIGSKLCCQGLGMSRLWQHRKGAEYGDIYSGSVLDMNKTAYFKKNVFPEMAEIVASYEHHYGSQAL